MKRLVLGALLFPLLAACGGGMEVTAGENPEVGEVSQAACSPYYYEFTYYSDCTKTQVVGWESLNCNGQRYLQGTRSTTYDAEIGDLCPAGCTTRPYYGTCR